jgi:hypothetical protein
MALKVGVTNVSGLATAFPRPLTVGRWNVPRPPFPYAELVSATGHRELSDQPRHHASSTGKLLQTAIHGRDTA